MSAFPKEQRTHFVRDQYGRLIEVATAMICVRSRVQVGALMRPGCKFTKKRKRMERNARGA
jgi:hypothetical protein